MTLYRYGARADWLVTKAKELFNWAAEQGWDNNYGGLVYGVAPDGSFYDDDKYFWVQVMVLHTLLVLPQSGPLFAL